MHLPTIIEELLIDFQELIGEHLGENMAEAIWVTMELQYMASSGRSVFGPQPESWFTHIITCLLTRLQIIAIVMDNASNNNTMMVFLER